MGYFVFSRVLFWHDLLVFYQRSHRRLDLRIIGRFQDAGIDIGRSLIVHGHGNGGHQTALFRQGSATGGSVLTDGQRYSGAVAQLVGDLIIALTGGGLTCGECPVIVLQGRREKFCRGIAVAVYQHRHGYR